MADLKVRATLDGSNFQGGISRLIGLSDGLKSKLAGAFTVGAIAAGVRKITDYADAIEEGASRAGVSAKALQEWSFGAKQNGADAEKLISFIERLTEASMDLKNAKGFAAMGIDPKGMTPEALFRSVQSRTQGKGATEIQGMLQSAGMSFKAIGPMVNTLSADLGAAGDSARRMGAVIDDATIRRLAALNDQLSIIGQVLMGQFAPALLTAGKAVLMGFGQVKGAAGFWGAITSNIKGSDISAFLKEVLLKPITSKSRQENLERIAEDIAERYANPGAVDTANQIFDDAMKGITEMIARISAYTPPPLPTIEPLPPDDKAPKISKHDSGRSDSLISVGNFLGARVREDVNSLQKEANKIAERNGVRLDKIADKVEKVNATIKDKIKDKTIIVP